MYLLKAKHTPSTTHVYVVCEIHRHVYPEKIVEQPGYYTTWDKAYQVIKGNPHMTVNTIERDEYFRTRPAEVAKIRLT